MTTSIQDNQPTQLLTGSDKTQRPVRYEVQHFTLCDGWINCWRSIDEDDKETPQTFDSEAAAQAELDEFFADIDAQIASGEREAEDGYERDDFRIVAILRV